MKENGKSLEDFPSLPQPKCLPVFNTDNYLILQELNYDREILKTESSRLVSSLNHQQHEIFDKIMHLVENSMGGFFFVYGYGGTGKTLLWNALICSLRSVGEIVIH